VMRAVGLSDMARPPARNSQLSHGSF